MVVSSRSILARQSNTVSWRFPVLPDNRRDVWDFLTLSLWTIFFAIGFAPEMAFYGLRAISAVTSFTALVNSSAMLTLSLTAYLAFFGYRRCIEWGLSTTIAQGKALEIAVLALVAFLEIPAKGTIFETRTLFSIVLEFRELPGLYLQTVVLFVGVSKLAAWVYLYSLVVRYHAFGNRGVFACIPSLFPSMRGRQLVEPSAEHSASTITELRPNSRDAEQPSPDTKHG